MDLRIAARVSIPIAAVAVLGALAIGKRVADAPAPIAKASKFVANCDRMDYAALEDQFGRDHVSSCIPGQFGEPAAVVTTIDGGGRRTIHVIGRDLRELVPPRQQPDHDWPTGEPRCAYGAQVDFRVADLNGDGVDEIIDWMRVGNDINIRVIAVRDGTLAISRDHRYPRWTDPMAAARAILANCHFD